MDNVLEIDFLITQNCNYRCEYCSQSKKFVTGKLLGASDEVIFALLKFLSLQKRKFEVTISGGEPILHPKFFFLVEEIVKMGGGVSVVSNFSFPFKTYEKLKQIAGENLMGLFVSLHTTQVNNIEEFLDKADKFNKIKGETKFTVGSVLTDENCETLKRCAENFKKNGVNFELQHMRIKNEFVKYEGEAAEFIKKYPIEKIKEKSGTFGKECRAGRDFMIVYEDGEAYRCYSSRFNKIHSMGNIKNKNFKMFSKTLPCLNKKCTCPKPILRGMIDYNKENLLFARVLSAYNLFWLPYFVVKKFDIIKTKFAQAKKIKNKT